MPPRKHCENQRYRIVQRPAAHFPLLPLTSPTLCDTSLFCKRANHPCSKPLHHSSLWVVRVCRAVYYRFAPSEHTTGHLHRIRPPKETATAAVTAQERPRTAPLLLPSPSSFPLLAQRVFDQSFFAPFGLSFYLGGYSFYAVPCPPVFTPSPSLLFSTSACGIAFSRRDSQETRNTALASPVSSPSPSHLSSSQPNTGTSLFFSPTRILHHQGCISHHSPLTYHT